MKITATYTPEQRAYIIQAGEQQIVVPAPYANKLATTIERAICHQQREEQTEMLHAKKLVEEAHHPAVLPFTAEKSATIIKPRGRPKGTKSTMPAEQRIKKAKAKKREPPKPEPQPFRHVPFK